MILLRILAKIAGDGLAPMAPDWFGKLATFYVVGLIVSAAILATKRDGSLNAGAPRVGGAF